MLARSRRGRGELLATSAAAAPFQRAEEPASSAARLFGGTSSGLPVGRDDPLAAKLLGREASTDLVPMEMNV